MACVYCCKTITQTPIIILINWADNSHNSNDTSNNNSNNNSSNDNSNSITSNNSSNSNVASAPPPSAVPPRRLSYLSEYRISWPPTRT